MTPTKDNCKYTLTHTDQRGEAGKGGASMPPREGRRNASRGLGRRDEERRPKKATGPASFWSSSFPPHLAVY